MPHIIVEYSKNLESQIEIPAMLQTLHTALADQGVDAARIKTRGIAVDHAVVGDQGMDGKMLHATLLLLEGRDDATKKQYADPIYAAMKAATADITNCAVTLELRDMAAATYYM